MRPYLVVALAILCVGAPGCGEREMGDRNELDSDAAGMGNVGERNVAMGHLYTVATVHVGLTKVSFSRDSATGSRTISYRGDIGPSVSKEERAALIDPVVAKLLLIADTDRSGSVSDKEAGDFRRLYEFAYRFSAAEDSGESSPEMIAEDCGMSITELHTSILAYNQLVVRAGEVGLGGLSDIPWDGQD